VPKSSIATDTPSWHSLLSCSIAYCGLRMQMFSVISTSIWLGEIP
jgi:hypothetical protein